VTGAEAKTISITIGQKAEIRGENLVVKISVGNTGDESAKSVAPNLRFGDKTVRGKLHDDLAPNATFEEELTIATGRSAKAAGRTRSRSTTPTRTSTRSRRCS
jgi:hypothetical protein